MVQSFTGGEVGINVSPDTTGFRRKLERFLHSLDNDLRIKIDADPSAYDRAVRERAGREYKSTIKLDGDYSALDQLAKRDDQMRRQIERNPIKLEFDNKPVVKSLRDTVREVKRFGDTASESFGNSFSRKPLSELGKLDLQAKLYRGTVKDVADEQRKLAVAEAARYEAQVKRIADLKAKSVETAGDYDYLSSKLAQLKNDLKTARSRGDDSEVRALTDTIAKATELRKQARKDRLAAEKEYNKAVREQSKAVAEYRRNMLRLGRTASETFAKLKPTVDQAKTLSSQVSDMAKSADSLAFAHASGLNQWGHLLDDDTSKTLELSQAQKEAAAQAEAFAKATDHAGQYVRQAKDGLSDFRTESRKLTDVLDAQEKELDQLSKAFQKAKPFGIDKGLALELNNARTSIRRLREEAVRNPIQIKYNLDILDWDRKYDELMGKALNLRDKLSKDNELNVRVKYWEDNAEKIEDRLRKLTHERVDIPVDWQVDQKRIAQRMREVAAEIKAHPDRAVELEANLDLDMKRAEKRIKDFEDKNDELKMDVDLETALARAHLAYFTRPRTVDIFANFKGTDLGKIMAGMTSGATGLKGVEDQFQKLVNLFDNLNTVVPKWSLLGAGVTVLGAGLLNLGRTAGSVGVSLVSMTKAAMAAPAALTGLGAAGFAAYAAYKQMGDQFDVTKTKLAGLQKDVGTAFWSESKQAVTDLANSLNGNLRSALVDIAKSEGQVVSGLAEVVKQSNASNQLPHIFDNTNKAIQNLNPGLQSLTKAFLGLGDQSSQYLPRMASYVSNIADGWARWVQTAENTGQINTAIQEAVVQGGYLKSSVMDLLGILDGTFGTLAKNEQGLKGFSEAIHAANQAVQSTKFQETLKAWSDGAEQAQKGMRNSFKDVGDALYSLKDITGSVFADAGQIVGSGITAISRVLQQSKNGIRDFSSGIKDGFTSAFQAIGDAGPMFSSLATMVGNMSRTFGGTFASTLKAAAPSIQAIATVAGTIANLFNTLPGPLKAVIGMWATFGRAGLQAFNSLKTGMLQSITSTMQYQQMLRELGLAADQASVKMGTLIRAMQQVRSGSYAGALSGAISEVRAYGNEAERSAEKVRASGGASKEYASSTTTVVSSSNRAKTAIKEIGDEAEKAPKRFSGLKTAATGVIDAFGGWPGIAAMGISTTLAVIGSAISDYTAKAEASKAATSNVVEGMTSLKSSAKEAADSFKSYQQQIKKNWSDSSTVFGDGAGGWFAKIGTQMTGGFTDAKSAANQLGISMKTLNGAVSGNEESYKKLVKQLEAASGETEMVSNGMGGMTVQFTTNAKAAQALLPALKSLHKDGWEKVVSGIQKYMNSAQQVTDMSSNLSNSIDWMNQSVQANGTVFKETGELIDSNNAAGQRTVGMFKDVASNALLAAQQMLAYGQKTGETGKYTQMATNAIYQAREAVIQSAMASGMGQQAAEAYADSLGLIPSNVDTTITADTTMARGEVESLLDSISGLTESQKSIILSLYDKGVLTSLGGIENMVTQLMGGKVSQRALTLLMNADGDAEWKTANVKSNLLALGMSPKTYEWLLNGNGTAEERMQKVKDELSELNLSDKQIQWILDCIDNASPVTDKAKQDKDSLKNPVSFTISVNDQTAAAFANVQAKAEVLEDGKTVVISGDDTDYLNKVAQVTGTQIDPKTGTLTLDKSQFDIAMALAAGAQIDPKTGLLKGDNSDLMQKVAQANGWKIDEKTGVIKGDNGQALSAIAYVNAQRVGEKNFAIIANDNATQVISRLQHMQIGNKSFTVTAYYTSAGEKVVGGTIPKSARANGGRVYGPGTSTSDSIHTMLSNGEMVIRAAAVRKLDAKYGPQFLNLLNEFGDVEKARRPSATALRYRARSYALASGGRVSDVKTPVIQVNPTIVGSSSSGVDAKDMQAAVAAGMSAALKQSQMRLAFDARGAARVMAEPMSREIGLLERSGRMR